MFFYIFTCFFIFFFRRLAAIKHFLLYRTDVVYIKTYPFGMIKLIQQIYGIYPNPHTGFYW